MSSNVPTNPPEFGGNTYARRWGGAGGIKKLLQCKVMPYFKMRIKQDDSKAVLMSDQQLGGGVRQTGSAK